MRYTGRWAAAGAAPSVDKVGDAYDNALAETVIGLFKTEVIHRDGPWRGFEDVEMATLAWVAWFNQERLLEPLGHVPPSEFEAQYYDTHHTHTSVGVLHYTGLLNTRRGSVRRVRLYARVSGGEVLS